MLDTPIFGLIRDGLPSFFFFDGYFRGRLALVTPTLSESKIFGFVKGEFFQKSLAKSGTPPTRSGIEAVRRQRLFHNCSSDLSLPLSEETAVRRRDRWGVGKASPDSK